MRKSFCAQRVVIVWSALPVWAVEGGCLTSFQKYLDEHNITVKARGHVLANGIRWEVRARIFRLHSPQDQKIPPEVKGPLRGPVPPATSPVASGTGKFHPGVSRVLVQT